jgi:hypothetical protein
VKLVLFSRTPACSACGCGLRQSFNSAPKIRALCQSRPLAATTKASHSNKGYTGRPAGPVQSGVGEGALPSIHASSGRSAIYRDEKSVSQRSCFQAASRRAASGSNKSDRVEKESPINRLLARPKRFELLTPRSVVSGNWLISPTIAANRVHFRPRQSKGLRLICKPTCGRFYPPTRVGVGDAAKRLLERGRAA